MALKMFGRKGSGDVVATSPETSQSSPQYFDEKKSGDYKDVEGGFAPGVPRRGSRIDKPKVGSSLAGLAGNPNGLDDDSVNNVSVGKQMEMEADNAIKYRTCSWQKVPFPCSFV